MSVALAVQVIAYAVRVAVTGQGLGASASSVESTFTYLRIAVTEVPQRVKVYDDEDDEDEEELEDSSWDPPGHEEIMETSRCRAFFLEIMKRAIHDWVLYRSDSKNKEVAEEAYTWLFEEDEDHPWARKRKKSIRRITSFLAICEILDLDPKFVREHAKKVTIKQIMTAGRPAEKRTRVLEEPHYQEHKIQTVDLGAIEESESNQFSSIYEAHYAVYTSD